MLNRYVYVNNKLVKQSLKTLKPKSSSIKINIKRKREDVDEDVDEDIDVDIKFKKINPPKKPKLNTNVWDDFRSELNTSKKTQMKGWVSATQTKNYILDDPCIDWIKRYHPKFKSKFSKSKESHLNMLFESGNRFEQDIYSELSKLYDKDFEIVFAQQDYEIFKSERSLGKNSHIRAKYNQTLNLMKQSKPIIAQAVMINDSNQTYGIADLLIRADCLGDIFQNLNLDDINPLDKTYRVIDCKWTTLPLCVDNKTIRNEGLFPAYKAQLAVYTACLEQMQNYTPNQAFVMCKAWKTSKYRGYSAFDKLGIIDYGSKDRSILAKTRDAIRWIRRLESDGKNWSYGDQPSVIEMYPNMSKNFDPIYSSVKKSIAQKYGEITQVWYLNTKHRELARSHNILDVRDPRLNTQILNITNTRQNTIQQILDINKLDQTDLIRPSKIKSNEMNWQEPHILDYYVDFETMNYNLFEPQDLDDSYFESDITFMIGIGFETDSDVGTNSIISNIHIDKENCGLMHKKDDRWEYICIYMKRYTTQNEIELFKTFWNFIIHRNSNLKKIYNLDIDLDSRLFHWTKAELRFSEKAMSRFKSKEIRPLIRCFKDTVVWVDLCAEMQSEPVVVKGCYRYKLKHFANAMYDNGLIGTRWGDTKMSDGFTAMLEAIKIYKSIDIVTHRSKPFRSIIDYNEVDCKVMWEIVEYLRDNHT